MNHSKKKKIRSFQLFLMILPFLILVFLFAYFPLYGWVYAFFDYKPPKPLSNSAFVGFKWFQSMVSNKIKVRQLLEVLRNTFVMSGITIGTSWLPMIFAVFLNEIRSTGYRKTIQVITTLPNFISWVLVYSIAFSLFNSTGMMNTFLMKLGIIDTPRLYLQDSDHVWLVQWLWLTWKNLERSLMSDGSFRERMYRRRRMGIALPEWKDPFRGDTVIGSIVM